MMPTKRPSPSGCPAALRGIAGNVQTRQQVLSQDKVRQLVEEDPTHHEAYEFAYDTPERPLTATEVRAMIVRVSALAAPLHVQGLPLAEVRRRLVAAGDDVRLFATNSHPKLFERITDPATPPGFIDNIIRMVEVRRAVEAGEVDEARAVSALQQHILRSCSAP